MEIHHLYLMIDLAALAIFRITQGCLRFAQATDATEDGKAMLFHHDRNLLQ